MQRPADDAKRFFFSITKEVAEQNTMGLFFRSLPQGE